jgi:hypothetical protein
MSRIVNVAILTSVLSLLSMLASSLEVRFNELEPPWGHRPRRRLKWPLIAAIVAIVAAAITGYDHTRRHPKPQPRNPHRLRGKPRNPHRLRREWFPRPPLPAQTYRG